MKNFRDQFLLQKDIVYLNFGSFGACPRPVFEVYQQYQRELEAEPVQFFMKNGPRYLRESREALGKYVGAQGDDLVYVPNPSYAVNIVAKSMRLAPGDEILTTDLEYGACDRTWSFCCKQSGAVMKRQRIPLPVQSQEQLVEAFFNGVSSRTRMIFISHITSATALVLPVEAICVRARQLGIPCFVDGAHAPGQVPLNLSELGADYYTGACHKWMMTAKGCAFLHVKKERQKELDPLVVSWGYESVAPSHSQFLDYHEGQGTRDYSAFLTVPASIAFMQKNGWPEVAAACTKLVHENADRFASLLSASTLAPVDGRFIRQMLSLPVRTSAPEALQAELLEKYSIEIPVMRQGDRNMLRFSINAYNDQDDLDRLYEALTGIIKKGHLLLA